MVLHGSVVVPPKSPLQTTHIDDVVSQTGLSSEHCDDMVHSAQVLVVVLHLGAAPWHCGSITQATHLCMLVPLVAQMPERHTTVPSASVQCPSPLA